jgi:hypothetical protein
VSDAFNPQSDANSNGHDNAHCYCNSYRYGYDNINTYGYAYSDINTYSYCYSPTTPTPSLSRLRAAVHATSPAVIWVIAMTLCRRAGTWSRLDRAR